MAGESREAAVAAFLQRIRSTLGCVTRVTAVASPPIPGRPRGVTVYAAGQDEPSQLRLRTHGGHGDVILRLAHEFTTQRISRVHTRGLYEVSNSFYLYEILDLEENEIVVYHWHPIGASPITTPHLHVSAAGAIVLKQRAGSRLAGRKTQLGRFHLPTGDIQLEDIVELLIREFAVEPLRPDWATVLHENRREARREGT